MANAEANQTSDDVLRIELSKSAAQFGCIHRPVGSLHSEQVKRLKLTKLIERNLPKNLSNRNFKKETFQKDEQNLLNGHIMTKGFKKRARRCECKETV